MREPQFWLEYLSSPQHCFHKAKIVGSMGLCRLSLEQRHHQTHDPAGRCRYQMRPCFGLRARLHGKFAAMDE